MKLLLPLAIAALAGAAALPSAASAYPINYSLSFTGIVQNTQGATGFTDGDTVSGSLMLFSDGSIVSFIIGGQSMVAGSDTSALLVPSLTDAIYSAQYSPVALGGNLNTTLTLDLSALTSFPTADTAATLLTDLTQIPSNLDSTITDPTGSEFPSTFQYYIANADGTNILALTADLTAVAVTVPEPASLALLATSVLGFGMVRRRR